MRCPHMPHKFEYLPHHCHLSGPSHLYTLWKVPRIPNIIQSQKPSSADKIMPLLENKANYSCSNQSEVAPYPYTWDQMKTHSHNITVFKKKPKTPKIVITKGIWIVCLLMHIHTIYASVIGKIWLVYVRSTATCLLYKNKNWNSDP